MTDDGWFATTGWGPNGTANLEARGSDPRAALEAGLRGALALVVDPETTTRDERIAMPVHGSGDDLEALFVDLTADLFAQLNDFGAVLYDVSLDGVLRRNEEGYRAWGYATAGPATTAFTGKLPELVEAIITVDSDRGVSLRATLRRR